MVEYFELSFLLFRLTNYHSYQSKGCINFLTTTLTTFNLYNFIRDLNLTKQLKIFFIKKLSQVVTRIGEEPIFFSVTNYATILFSQFVSEQTHYVQEILMSTRKTRTAFLQIEN